METHVKVLGILYLLFGVVCLVLAVFLMVVMGGTAGIVGASADAEEAAIAIPVLGIAGTALVALFGIFALPGLLTGYGLLTYRPWGRILGIVLSALNLINIPVGTLLGAYGLWVLLSKDTERLFDGRPVVSSTPL
jgi:hypothetical protein